MNREEFFAELIPEYDDIIQFWEDYNILLSEYEESICIDRDLSIKDNLSCLLQSMEHFYNDKFLKALFNTFFNVSISTDNLYNLFYDHPYITINNGNELIFDFDYFIETIEKFLKKSNIEYTINTNVDYNRMVNDFNSKYYYKCTYIKYD